MNSKRFLKPKIKSCCDEVTDFWDNEAPKDDSCHTCSAVISLNFALIKDENYYSQVFLKECKYIEKKVVGHVIDDFESSSDDSYDFHEE